jgi:hypothetical protein
MTGHPPTSVSPTVRVSPTVIDSGRAARDLAEGNLASTARAAYAGFMRPLLPLARALGAALLATGSAACIAPPTAADRLTDAAYEMNMATRFGRMDVAMSFVGEKARKNFMNAHAGWGRGIRIADLEFAGVDIPTKEEASVLIHVSWQRIDESTLRTTSILQKWKDDEKVGWLITEEKRVGGDAGLIDRADAPAVAPKGSPPDAPPARPDAAPTQGGRFSTTVIPADAEAVD